MKSLKMLAVGALATILMVGGAHAASHYVTAATGSVGGASAGAATGTSTNAVKLPVTTGAGTMVNGEAEVKATLTFDSGIESVSINGAEVTIDEDDYTYELTDKVSLDEFKDAILNDKATVTREYKIQTVEEETGDVTNGTFTVEINTNGNPTFTEGKETVWGTDVINDLKAGKVLITVKMRSLNSLYANDVKATTNDIKFYFNINSDLTVAALNEKVANYLADNKLGIVGYYNKEIKTKDEERELFVDPTTIVKATTVYLYVDEATSSDVVTDPTEDPADQTQDPADPNLVPGAPTSGQPGAQSDKNTEDVKSPNTGDNFGTLVSMISASAAGLFVTFKKTILG